MTKLTISIHSEREPKLRVRGLYKASEYFILSAIGINFGRISRFFSFELFFEKIKGFLFFEKRKCSFFKIIEKFAF